MKTLFVNSRRCRPELSKLPVQAFTLVEVLLSMVILAMIMLIVTQVIGQAQKSWKAASSRVSQFREARTAFDTVSRGLRQATLPSYRDWGYGPTKRDDVPLTPTEPPTGIKSDADLGFVSGPATRIVTGGGSADQVPGHAIVFHAPLGQSVTPGTTAAAGALEYGLLKSLLNVRGYFVRFGSDAEYLPTGLASRLQVKNRYRLFEYRPPTEENSALDSDVVEGTWANISANSNYLMPVAENIVAIAFGLSFAAPDTATGLNLSKPATSGSSSVPYYSAYNSYSGAATGGTGPVGYNQLPRAVQVIMVALDEESSSRLALQHGSSPPGLLSRAGVSFNDPAAYDQDIVKLKKSMQELKLNYRVFSSIILVPASNT